MQNHRLLIANRGEVALRILRSARELGLSTVAMHAADDAGGQHCGQADRTIEIPGTGVKAYLDAAAITNIAQTEKCTLVHPGYGFLAESADFAARVIDAGIGFVGPDVAALRALGDKIEARNKASGAGIPVLPASANLESAEQLEQFHAEHGEVIVKAAAGGGGRGMRVVSTNTPAEDVWRQASREAEAAFGDARIYAEKMVNRARHIEVQIAGDSAGTITQIGERDCTLQRRHQKIAEFAPAPMLDKNVRDAMLAAAVELARAVSYQGLGTVEFLLDTTDNAFYFIEANARLQVEHTVTESVYGVDLVRAQLRLATGADLAKAGLGPDLVPRGMAVQLRINAESADPDGTLRPASGTITSFRTPGGPGIRIDTAAYAGYDVNPSFDSLVAKLVVHSDDGDLSHLLARARRAIGETEIAGVSTNLGMLASVLDHAALRDYRLTTTFIESERSALIPAEGDGPATANTPVATLRDQVTHVELPAGQHHALAPMRGSVVSIETTIGDNVRRGQPVAVLDSMKMHHDVPAPVSGTVLAVVIDVDDVVDEGEALMVIECADADEDAEVGQFEIDLDAQRADLDEVWSRHALTTDQSRPQAVAKRRKIGSRTARENVEDLCDPDSFIEYGALAIAAQRRRRSLEDLQVSTPADGMIAGFGTVNASAFGPDESRCAVFAYDYTVLAGTQGHHNHKKKDRLFELARDWNTPIVFFTEGGGGRPGDVDTEDLFMAWLDLRTFATWPQLSGTKPRIAVNSGRCYAGNAVIFGCADITIATENSNIGLAGPAMIEGGGLGRFKPEDIGPIDVQTRNGVVDIACSDEAEATHIARQVLGCFQGPLSEWTASDQRLLRHLVPEDRLKVYDMRAIIDGLADEGSVIEFRRDYGIGLITALVRIEGRAFGLIANDPRHLGGAIDGPGGEKGGRFLQLCDAYGLPVISLCDTPGFMVGPDSEETAAVRRGSRLILASANLNVPLFTVVVRKGYGLGAQAMAGGSFHQPFFTIAWPTAEMGPMGLEGAVELGFRKELEASPSEGQRRQLFDELVGEMYRKGKAVSVASCFEIDAVIDPAETRSWLTRGARAAGRRSERNQRYVDVW